MERPISIVRFERLYLGSLALWIVEKAAFWSQARAAAVVNPAYAANPQLAGIIGPVMVVTTLAIAAVSLLFWYLVVRRASVVGKWLIVATEALGGVFLLLAVGRLLLGSVASSGDFILGAIVTLLGIAAAATLFRPDAVQWFRNGSHLLGGLR